MGGLADELALHQKKNRTNVDARKDRVSSGEKREMQGVHETNLSQGSRLTSGENRLNGIDALTAGHSQSLVNAHSSIQNNISRLDGHAGILSAHDASLVSQSGRIFTAQGTADNATAIGNNATNLANNAAAAASSANANANNRVPDAGYARVTGQKELTVLYIQADTGAFQRLRISAQGTVYASA